MVKYWKSTVNLVLFNVSHTQVNASTLQATMQFLDPQYESTGLPRSGKNVWKMKKKIFTVREKCLENEIFSRSGKSQGMLWMAREI